MRVLLTGHRGFVGRHLHAALEARGDDVTGIDLADGSGDALDFFRADNQRWDLAIHCAAIVGGRASIDGSPLGVATNLALDAWYMRWLIRTGTPRAVYFSSSAAYPIELQQPGDVRKLYEEDIDLDHPEQPDASYGWAKLTGEKLATYAEAEGCRILIPRPFSGYGEDQDEAYPFPAFIQRAKRRDDPFEIWGSGDSTRDWIHISDLVAATLALLAADVTGPVNLGWGRATSFNDLAAIVCAGAGYRPQLKHLPSAPQGVHHRVSDPGRMLDHYQPAVTLEEGVRRALAD
ncbi:NAD-dependent epimerase/dehydratase family protein [Streptomyces sp. NBC_01485]|uniref:NAD-dependent epimerase/dehydratase family protein n=1 Tax=Streptomyces sp. NBC_01485 TaxID=2903884 RepID=UPI002E2EC782|nr:NAD-dependent epimerase/dehydratase family protein [Streptomyces sp. NBC_01485]